MEARQPVPHLDPCPFCASTPMWNHYEAGGKLWSAACSNGDCPVAPETRYFTRLEAADKWNRRADRDIIDCAIMVTKRIQRGDESDAQIELLMDAVIAAGYYKP